MNPILSDTAVKASLESEIEVHRKSTKHDRVLNSSQEKARKSKRLKKGLSKI